MRPSRASLIATKKSVLIRNFETYATAPVLRAACTKSGSACTVKKTTFDVEPDSLSRLAASIPLSFGIEMSVTMTSGCSLPAASIRDSPSPTAPTTSKLGSRRPRINSKRPRWSSARSTRILRTSATRWAQSARYEPSFPWRAILGWRRRTPPLMNLARRVSGKVRRTRSPEHCQKKQGFLEVKWHRRQRILKSIARRKPVLIGLEAAFWICSLEERWRVKVVVPRSSNTSQENCRLLLSPSKNSNKRPSTSCRRSWSAWTVGIPNSLFPQPN
jgi:hypothetical protein